MSVKSLLASVVGVEDVGLGVGTGGTRSGSEVLEGFSSSGSSEENGVLTEGSDFRQLIKGQDFSASLQNSSAGFLADSQSAHSELGNSHESFVVEDVADNDQDLASLLVIVSVLG